MKRHFYKTIITTFLFLLAFVCTAGVPESTRYIVRYDSLKKVQEIIEYKSATKPENKTFENIVTFIVTTLSLITLWRGIGEYKKGQAWKKSEFVSKEVNSFFENFDVKRAMLMLDWNSILIELTETETLIYREGTKKIEAISFTDALFETALRYHPEMGENETFSKDEALIRQIFDSFLFKLGLFNNYLEAKLLRPEELKPYLEYPLGILSGKNPGAKPSSVIKAMAKYITSYQNTEVIKLMTALDFSTNHGA